MHPGPGVLAGWGPLELPRPLLGLSAGSGSDRAFLLCHQSAWLSVWP